MNKRATFDQSTIRIVYYQYRDYIVCVVVIVVCIFLIMQFIVPHVVTLQKERGEEAAYRQRIATLRENVSVLANVDENTLLQQFQIASSALPPGKNFAGVLESIAVAARTARVSVGDYSFEVGDLSTESAKLAAAKPFLQLTLTITGDIGGANRFIESLMQQMPLSEVLSLSTGGSSSSLTTVFYYKPFVIASDGFDLTKPLSPLSQEETRLLEELRLPELPPPPPPVVATPTATASPQLLP